MGRKPVAGLPRAPAVLVPRRISQGAVEVWGEAEEHNATDLRLGRPGFKSQPCHLPAVGFWARYQPLCASVSSFVNWDNNSNCLIGW